MEIVLVPRSTVQIHSFPPLALAQFLFSARRILDNYTSLDNQFENMNVYDKDQIQQKTNSMDTTTEANSDN